MTVTHGTGDSCLQLLTMITEKRIAHPFELIAQGSNVILPFCTLDEAS